MNLKEEILSKVDSLNIFKRYIGGNLKLGRAMKSPLRDGDKHPSFNVYRNRFGKCLFKDFAGEEGDAFYFVMLLYNVDFKTAIEIVADDFNVSKKDMASHRKNRPAMANLPKIEVKKRAKFNYKPDVMAGADYSFWLQFGISQTALEYFKVGKAKYAGSQTMTEDGSLRDWRLTSSELDPIYFYDYENGGIRFYRPNAGYSLKHFGNVNGNDVFGLNQAREAVKNQGKLDTIAICAGQKDVISLYSNTGIHGIALNSESCHMPIELFFELKDLADNLVVIYDNDETGVKYSKRLENDFGIRRVTVPGLLNGQMTVDGIKDISDYYKHILVECLPDVLKANITHK